MTAKHAVAALASVLGLMGASLAAGAEPASAHSTGDKFIKEAIEGNLAEVKVGQLAQEKGSSQGVKDFGAMLAKDHDAANQSATQAAQQLNVTPPDKPGMKQTAVYDKLSGLSGESFDRQFIKDMVKDHEEDVAKYEKESHKTGPAAAYAKQTLPRLRAHLKMAQDLQSSEVASASQSSKTR